MSRLGINTGSTANDGTGDSLRSAMGKVNTNFLELYSAFGDGFNLISYASTAGISTLAKNLTGNPIITVGGVISSGISSVETIQTNNLTVAGVVTAIQFKGDGSQLTNVSATNPGVQVYDENIFRGVAKGLNFGANIIAGVPDGSGRVTISVASSIAISNALYSDSSGISSYSSISGVSTYSYSSGISTYAITSGISTYATTSGVSTTSIKSGYASTSGISTVAQGLTGTPNLNVGVVTATSYRGSGVNLTGIITTLVAGTNITINQFAGIATINSSGGGSGAYATIAGYSTSSGIATVAQGLTGTPNISVGQVGISSFVSVSGITSFYNDVHFEYDKVLSIGNADELQLFHNGANSYIRNASTNNLIIRTTGGSIQLNKEGPELMGVFNSDGSVELYYDNVKKFETIGSGVTISGAVFAQQLIGDILYTNQIVNTGVVTATSFSGSGANLTGIITSLVAGTNVTITQSSGIATINATAGGGGSIAGIDTTGTSFFNQLNVSGVSTFAGITTVTGVSLFSRQLSVSGVSTFAGITTVTGVTLFAKQLDVAGVSTFAGITTVTGVTLFTKQLSASGVATALSFVGAGTSLTGLDASNISLGTLTNSRLPSNINVSGVVTATRFESTSSGTPTIGAATTISLETIKVAISTDITVGRNANVSGIVTATGGFISVGNTTPIQISLVGNQLTFTAVGIGSTTLTLF